MEVESPTFIPTRYPAVRLLFGVAMGIALQLAISWNSLGFFVASGVCLASGIGLFIAKKFTASYWLCAIIIGLWIGFHGSVLTVPTKSIGEIPAVINGEITSLLRKDSASVRCIVEGNVDAKALPALEPCRVILVVHNPTCREYFLETGARIYAVVSLRLPLKSSLPAEFDELQYCKANEVQFMARAEPSKVALLERSSGFTRFVYSSAGAIDRIIHSLYTQETGAIVSALVLGDKTRISEETRSTFSLSGTAHLLAVSGFHVGIIASGVFLLLGIVRNRWAKFIIFTIVLGLFVVMSGLQPSAIRAGIMVELALLTLILERRIIGLNIVALALVLVMIFSPKVIYSPGFQMSAASILGISVLFAPFKRGLGVLLPFTSWFGELIIASLAVTFSASVMVSPLVAYYFSIFSLVSPLANLLVIPLMSLAMVWVFCSLVFAPINWGITTTFSAASSACIHTAESVNTWAIGFKFAAVQSPELAVVIASLSSVGLVYILLVQSKRQSLFRLTVTSVVMVFSLVIVKPNITINSAFTRGESVRLTAPRMNVVARIIPLKKGVTAALITDRKPHQYPFGDPALQRYLLGLNDSLLIGIQGNSSEWIAAQVRNLRPSTHIFTYPKYLRTMADESKLK
ncbi:MAG: ComEC/Rec2 family competence protein [Bacteroidetes bacterium]|nr:ComEC/Rec2 family competence protein [Bacteroidota bacterium]